MFFLHTHHENQEAKNGCEDYDISRNHRDKNYIQSHNKLTSHHPQKTFKSMTPIEKYQ